MKRARNDKFVGIGDHEYHDGDKVNIYDYVHEEYWDEREIFYCPFCGTKIEVTKIVISKEQVQQEERKRIQERKISILRDIENKKAELKRVKELEEEEEENKNGT
jgi:DNA-binding transcriptional regulator GbsR (MarR family)